MGYLKAGGSDRLGSGGSSRRADQRDDQSGEREKMEGLLEKGASQGEMWRVVNGASRGLGPHNRKGETLKEE